MPRRDRHRDERGALSLEFLLVMVMLVAVFMLMLQYAVKAYAQRAATAAAEEALAAAATYDGSSSEGEAAGSDFLKHVGPGLSHAHVVVTRNDTTASANVSGDVLQLLPFVPLRVEVHLEGPVEHFVEP